MASKPRKALSSKSLPRHGRTFLAKPALHEAFCRGIPSWPNYETTCFAIARRFRKKNKLVAEYALRGLDQSIAVAAWQTQLTETLPEELRGSLPTIEEIEAELARDLTPETPG